MTDKTEKNGAGNEARTRDLNLGKVASQRAEVSESHRYSPKSPEDRTARNAKVLSDEQLEAFDVEYIGPDKWAHVRHCIDVDFSDAFSMLDVGGGNGAFADRVLKSYPRSRVTVLDLSEMLLARNKPHLSKEVVVGSATELGRVKQRFDIISINWVLHHLVTDSYATTIENIVETLRQAARLLLPGGRISIWDNLYDGLAVDIAPSRLIYALTSMRAAASLVRMGGANTAGVGVCFQSERRWRRHFAAAGLRIEAARAMRPFEKPVWKHAVYGAALHLRPVRPAHFWLSAR